LQLEWTGINITSISVTSSGGQETRPNALRTFWMKTDVDLSRGLDFLRSSVNNLGPIWARVRHLNHETFTYSIAVGQFRYQM